MQLGIKELNELSDVIQGYASDGDCFKWIQAQHGRIGDCLLNDDDDEARRVEKRLGCVISLLAISLNPRQAIYYALLIFIKLRELGYESPTVAAIFEAAEKDEEVAEILKMMEPRTGGHWASREDLIRLEKARDAARDEFLRQLTN